MIPLLQIGQIGLGLYIANHVFNTLCSQGLQCVDSEPQGVDSEPQGVDSGPQGVVGTDGDSRPQGVVGTDGDSGPQGVVGTDGVVDTEGDRGPQGSDNSDTLKSIRDEVPRLSEGFAIGNRVKEQRKSIMDESMDSILAKRKSIVFKDGLSGSFTYARISTDK